MGAMSETPEHHETPATTSTDSPSVAVFSMRKAAEVAGVSVSTLRRRRSDLEAAGARITSEGWEVPITALEATGLIGPQKAASSPQAVQQQPEAPEHEDELAEALERIRELERELLEQRHRAELAEIRQAAAEQRARAAEILAEDRGRTLEVERRMLPPGPSAYAQTPQQEPPAPAPAPTPETPQETPQQPRRHAEPRPSWWQRTFG